MTPTQPDEPKVGPPHSHDKHSYGLWCPKHHRFEFLPRTGNRPQEGQCVR